MSIIEEARRGIITDEIKSISKLEKVSPEKVRKRIAEGKIMLLRNVKRPSKKLVPIGKGLTTKININIGTSSEVIDLDMELEKVKISNKWGDTLMDLSTGGDIDEIRRKIIDKSDLPVGTVPVYQAFIQSFKKKSGGAYFSEDELLSIVERQLKDGVAFMTIHAGLTRELAIRALKSDRVIPIVSRGGDMIAGWMIHNGKENPYRTNWKYLLELFKEYDATISLGDALRPGATADAHDEFQIGELIETARLVKDAINNGVQVMVEGPGHVPLNEVAWDVKLMKKLTGGVPYYVLGPLVIDVGAPYDHIASSIGAAIASAAGADLLCYLTPAEHLSLPNAKQVEEGAIAYRIAAHAGDIVKLGKKVRKWDDEVSYYRGKLEWDKMIEKLIDPEQAYKVYTQFGEPNVKACTMCGGYCPMMWAMEQVKKIG
ncbi:phosphomethylpyrimidine synthase ThiC [Sulfolobus acidocaldarius]|uniref:Phosphomethylpyrimidine synthase n=4 Tax=Sulfolobus acidocaldarius TaxID=2285 RepID=THIC_SULAC|nr:phosphomethylpyrimidine synthase ThiC [Sulfolobus acidocaldarius]Q4JCB9.1 RecName: Full=Phosphomethylpyrimidine synthase; AltName: Full=Hydroxymethylpyrimidine phosphate synthase; Short=HMP-P synthase; Short=HMP-phosphate synthase; Short=HMPP synthase; AltName: Full=Thiamine biosynthesis protein ThiC [Sulfolobus acidocaldarius DSM 639]AAY79560.1 thiamine biosynthesis protein [Sulfolobus acidocaldarius DSM 639]AGE70111.1 thiamine biosynthesis protein ThiC [Sulfolobus acidocaldarius N8]AGE7238